MKMSCSTCKYLDESLLVEPCCSCKDFSNWEDENEDGVPEPDHEPDHDPVHHPSHYCQEGSMECIDEMVAVFGEKAVMEFCLLNVWKYRKRAIFKNGVEDLKKSDWYLKKYIELKGELYGRK